MAKEKRKSQDGTSSEKEPLTSSEQSEPQRKEPGVKRIVFVDKTMTAEQMFQRAKQMAKDAGGLKE